MSVEIVGNDYLIRRKVLTLLGAKFHVFDASERIVLFSEQKAFKLREDIRVYSDESMAEERLCIKARNIVDFSSAYDVVDTRSGTKIGTLRRKGLSSILRDAWEILDANDKPVGTIQEDSLALALVRRLLTNLVPQKFHAEVGGRSVAHYKQRFNPFVGKLEVSLVPGTAASFDPRLALATGILLMAIEGRQN